MKRHCRTCVCGVREPIRVNVDAPFYPLVLLIDRLSVHRRAEVTA